MYPLVSLLFLLLTCLPYPLFAQKFSFGPQGGACLARVEQNPFNNWNYRPGWQSGAFLKYRISKNISFHTELHFTTREQNFASIDTGSITKTLNMIFGSGGQTDSTTQYLLGYMNTSVYTHENGSVRMTYLELPLMATWTLAACLDISAGAYAALLTSALTKKIRHDEIPILNATHILDSFPEARTFISLFYPAYFSPVYEEKRETNRYGEFDYGLVVALAYRSPHDLIFSLRYTHGLADYRGYYNDPKITHRTFRFTIAYALENIQMKKTGKLNKASFE